MATSGVSRFCRHAAHASGCCAHHSAVFGSGVAPGSVSKFALKVLSNSLSAVKAAEESAKRQAFDLFLGELKVEQRHYTRENRMLMNSRKSLVLQERMYFRNIPLSDWIEHEVTLDDTADVDRMVQDMTVFDKAVVNIAEVPRRKQLA